MLLQKLKNSYEGRLVTFGDKEIKVSTPIKVGDHLRYVI
jgi:hypothetical protein